MTTMTTQMVTEPHKSCVGGRHRTDSGFVTIFIVAVIGLLSLLTLRQATVMSVSALQGSAAAQSTTISLYAAEVVMAEALSSFSGASLAQWQSGADVVVGQGSSVERTFTARFWIEQPDSSESTQYRIFAQASSGQISATVSQYVNFRGGVAYVIPGTWTDMEVPSS